MQAEIIIVSGFLGAGKTTLIQKFIEKSPSNEKVAIIENDFGDISVDAALIKSNNIEVKEINSGCICCSLSGDFIKALKELLEKYKPTKVIIEPSGVGKLSDIIKTCSDHRIKSLTKIKSKITVVDVKRCKMYLDNFGEFFEDQIKNANTIILNRSEESTDKVISSRAIVKELNQRANVFESINEFMTYYIQNINRLSPQFSTSIDKNPHDAKCSCKHCNNYNHAYHHEHNHIAEDVFDTLTIRTNKVFSEEDLKTKMTRMQKFANGTILRAKGIVRGKSGYLNLQYLPDDISVKKCLVSGNIVNIIGHGINKEELYALFEGE